MSSRAKDKPKRHVIVLIHGGNVIDRESAKMSRRAFAEYGYELEEISVLDHEAKGKLQALLRDRAEEIFFFYSSNFWALNVRRGSDLLHTMTGIPLVILMHDHPVYFLHQLGPNLNGAIIFAPGEDAADFIRKHYRVGVQAIAYPAVLPYRKKRGGAPNIAQFLERKNVLLCPMNLIVEGRTIDDVWGEIKELPTLRSARARRLVDAALTDCVTPLHTISERLAQEGDPEIAVEDLRPVLNFIKLWRRTRLVEEIIDLPVLVSSGYVPANLERRHPEKFTLLTMAETIPLYTQYRFVVNATPLLSYMIHDRIAEALIGNAVCITDANAVVRQYFADEKDMIFIDYERADLADKVARFIDDPQRAFELTVRCWEARGRHAFSKASHQRLLAAVEETWRRAPQASRRQEKSIA